LVSGQIGVFVEAEGLRLEIGVFELFPLLDVGWIADRRDVESDSLFSGQVTKDATPIGSW